MFPKVDLLHLDSPEMLVKVQSPTAQNLWDLGSGISDFTRHPQVILLQTVLFKETEK